MNDSDTDSPNHHLWLNRRTWWVAFTVILDGYRQERVRRSLGTRDLPTARERRDAVLREYASRPHVRLAARRQLARR
jgi:hypothetical protein